METQYVREFLVLSEVCNYHTAAQQLFVSQAALFKHMKALEEEIGVPLFDREGKRIVISKFGQMFLPYAAQLLRLEDHFIQDVDFSQDSAGVVLIGTQYRVTDVVSGFLRQDDRFRLRTIEGGEIDELLYRERCELAFIRNPDQKDGRFCSIPYTVDCLAAVMSVDHPLAKRQAVALEELRGESFVSLPNRGPEEDPALRYCLKAGFSPKVVMTAAPGNEVARLAGQGIGVALLTKKVTLQTAGSPVAVVDIYPKVTYDVRLCWRADVELSEGAKAFVAYVKALPPQNP